MGNAGLLLEHRSVSANSSARRLAREVIASGERAAALVSQLLAYSGRGRFMVVPTDMRLLLESHIAVLRMEMPDNVDLSLELADGVPVVHGDPQQFRDVITGLVKNAIEAIGSREGGEIRVALRAEQVEGDAALRAGEYCVVEVRDNGSGMDNDTLARAFDPFFSTKFPGRGLGLPAIQGIVRTAGGAIRVRSAPGDGSVFQVLLPTGPPKDG
jgi:signal transduction histidine kinase